MAVMKKSTTKKRGRPFGGGSDPMRSVRISDEIWGSVKTAAETAGVPVAEVVREGLVREVKRLEKRAAK